MISTHRRVWILPALLFVGATCSRPVGQTRPGGVVAPVPTRKQLRGEEHPVFSFVDNRLLAHRQRRGGLLIAAGSGGFVKYVKFAKPKVAWKLRQKADGIAVATLASDGPLEAPLTEQQANAADAIALRVKAGAAGKLVLKVNGADVTKGGVALAAGWQTIAIPVPAGKLTAGENQIVVSPRAKAGIAVAWIQIGGDMATDATATATATATADAADDELPALADPTTDTLVLRPHAPLVYYVHIPPHARLVGDVTGAGCEVVIHAASQDAAVSGVLHGKGGAVELPALAGQIARVEIAAGGERCVEARVAHAALAMPGKPAAIARPKQPKNVVLWVMDTLRVDRIPTFTPGARAEVPNLDRLAANGAVFLSAYSAGNESQVSQASIFTGAYPVTHKVIPLDVGGGWLMPTSWITLGGALKQAGLYGVGVTGNGFIVKDAGYGRGIAIYKNLMQGDDGVMKYNIVDGADVVRIGLDAVDKHGGDKPWFLFLGTVDTHVPLVGHQPWLDRYDPGPYKGKFEKFASPGDLGVSLMLSHTKPEARDFERMQAIYDSDVSYQDELLGKLLAKLDAWGVADDTMIVITADHGEEWWEQGIMGHGGSLRETLIHVPLLVYYPPLFPKAKIIEGGDATDVMPTILDAMGLAIPPEVQGESLLPLAQGAGAGYPRPEVSSMYEWAHTIRLGDWKLLVGPKGVPEIYDMRSAASDTADVSSTRPIERRFLTDAMSLYLLNRADWKKTRWGVASNMSAQAAADLD